MKRVPKYNCRMAHNDGFSIVELNAHAVGFDVIRAGRIVEYVSLNAEDAEAFAREILAKLGKE